MSPRVQFQAKQARREAQKAAKQDPLLKKQIQDLLKKGDTAKAYQKAKMLLSKQALAQQMDQMADVAELNAAQIQANNAMNRMTNMMGQSSRTMTAAQRNMNPERVRLFFFFSFSFPSYKIQVLTPSPPLSLTRPS